MRFIKLKNIIAGVLAAFVSAISILGCYPFVPAACAVYVLWNSRTLFFYIGLFIGMGYFMSFQAITKYLFIIIISFLGIRLYGWTDKRCNGTAAALIVSGSTFAMNFLGKMYTFPDRKEIILALAESAVIFGSIIVGHRMLEYAECIGKSKSEKQFSMLPDREEAFATAVGGLSKVIAKAGNTAVMDRNDYTAKMESEITGRMCACCEGCVICWNHKPQMMSQSILKLIDAVKSRMDKQQIMDQVYVENCPHYEKMVDAATEAFLRMELNEAWYKRLKENRQVIAKQLDAMAVLMEGWMNDEKCIDKQRRMKLTKAYVEVKEAGFMLEDMHIYENVEGFICIRAAIYTKWDGGIPVTRYVKAVSTAMGLKFRAAKDTKSIITTEVSFITLYEDTKFYALSGIATKKKTGSAVSGDSFGMFNLDKGIYNVCISDGMGSGKRASEESNLVVDLMEKFLEAGFEKNEALGMMNSAMVLSGEGDSFSTVDYAAINLYKGSVELIKIGAAVSFIKNKDGIEVIKHDSLPAGVNIQQDNTIIKRTLKDGDFLVMITDGVLEYLHVKEPAEKLCEIISDIQSDNAGVISQEILDRVLLQTGGYAMDDMTVITVRIWEK